MSKYQRDTFYHRDGVDAFIRPGDDSAATPKKEPPGSVWIQKTSCLSAGNYHTDIPPEKNYREAVFYPGKMVD